MDMAHYNAQPRSFGDIALEAGMSGLGTMFTAPSSSLAGKMGSKIGSKMFGI